ncbi:putative Zinc finger protein [Quillaja saponaria]|uniref:Zinc finger protein n=1 Tax=Quillaja saponaria TaxID=32244 RepID=A0AAD7LH52_QUISA|nr:putative Zinc finger protein [Quillaja saponaria]
MSATSQEGSVSPISGSINPCKNGQENKDLALKLVEGENSPCGDQDRNLSSLKETSPQKLPESSNQAQLGVGQRAPEKKYYHCRYCIKKFSTLQALGGHQNGHRLERDAAKREKNFHTPSRPSFDYVDPIFSRFMASNSRHGSVSKTLGVQSTSHKPYYYNNNRSRVVAPAHSCYQGYWPMMQEFVQPRPTMQYLARGIAYEPSRPTGFNGGIANQPLRPIGFNGGMASFGMHRGCSQSFDTPTSSVTRNFHENFHEGSSSSENLENDQKADIDLTLKL